MTREDKPICPLCDKPITDGSKHYGRIGSMKAPLVQIHVRCPGEVVMCEITDDDAETDLIRRGP